MITRRQIAAASAMLAAMHPLHRAFGQTAPVGAADAKVTTTHDISSMPANWIGSETIALLIYPEFTALDMVGPHHMFASLMGATTHIVAKSANPVTSDTGLVFVPSKTFADCPGDLDIICVPGGSSGTLAAMQDEETMRFLADRGSRAKYVTSVCTGSLLLGAAGLLEGYRATSHWATRDLLPIFGAIPTEGRVVRDRNRITGGGVTAGIDFGLAMVGDLRDRPYAEAVQLLAEYAPAPPYNSGSPASASTETRTMIEDMFVDFLKNAKATGEGVRRR
jgi:putative intracellular protease/amidase